MTENDSYDFAAPIRIHDGNPVAIFKQNGRVNFKSDDGEDYEINVKPDTISNTSFPLNVPGDNSTHGFTIKSDANGLFELYITKAKSEVEQSEKQDVQMIRQNPPRMIIRVD